MQCSYCSFKKLSLCLFVCFIPVEEINNDASRNVIILRLRGEIKAWSFEYAMYISYNVVLRSVCFDQCSFRKVEALGLVLCTVSKM